MTAADGFKRRSHGSVHVGQPAPGRAAPTGARCRSKASAGEREHRPQGHRGTTCRCSQCTTAGPRPSVVGPLSGQAQINNTKSSSEISSVQARIACALLTIYKQLILETGLKSALYIAVAPLARQQAFSTLRVVSQPKLSSACAHDEDLGLPPADDGLGGMGTAYGRDVWLRMSLKP